MNLIERSVSPCLHRRFRYSKGQDILEIEVTVDIATDRTIGANDFLDLVFDEEVV